MKKDIKKIVALIIVLSLLLSLFSQYIVSSAQNEMQIFLDFNSLVSSKNYWNVANQYGYAPPTFQDGKISNPCAFIGETKGTYKDEKLRINVKFTPADANSCVYLGLRSNPNTYTINDDYGQQKLYDPWNSNLYYIYVNNVGTLTLNKYNAGVNAQFASASTSLADGTQHVIQFSAVNNTENTSVMLSVFIDGEEIASYTDSTAPFINSGKLYIKNLGPTEFSAADTSTSWPIAYINLGTLVSSKNYWNVANQYGYAPPTFQNGKITNPCAFIGETKGTYKDEKLRINVKFTPADANSCVYLGLRSNPNTYTINDDYGQQKLYDPWNSNLYYIYVNNVGTLTLNKYNAGVNTQFASASTSLADGTQHAIQLSAVNNIENTAVVLSVFIDGKEIASYTDSTAPFISSGKLYIKNLGPTEFSAADTSISWPLSYVNGNSLVSSKNYWNVANQYGYTPPTFQDGKISNPCAFIGETKGTYKDEKLRINVKFTPDDANSCVYLGLRSNPNTYTINDDYGQQKLYDPWNSNLYYIYVNNVGTLTLNKYNAGVNTQFASASTSLADGTQHAIQLSAVNNIENTAVVLSVFIDGKEIASYTDSTAPFISSGKLYIKNLGSTEFTASDTSTSWPLSFVDVKSLISDKYDWNFANQYGYVAPTFKVEKFVNSGGLIGETKSSYMDEKLRINVKFTPADASSCVYLGLRSNPNIYTMNDEYGQQKLYDPWNSNLYYIYVNNVGTLTLNKYNTGVNTQFASKTTSLADGTHHVVQFSAVNNTTNTSVMLSVFIDGEEIASYTDSATPFINSGKFYIKNLGPTEFSAADTSISWPLTYVNFSPLVSNKNYWNVANQYGYAPPTFQNGKITNPCAFIGESKGTYKDEKLRINVKFTPADANSCVYLGLRSNPNTYTINDDYGQQKLYDPWNSNLYYIYVNNVGTLTLNKYNAGVNAQFASASTSLADGTQHVIQFSAVNNTENTVVALSVFIDGEEIASYTDSSAPFVNNGKLYIKNLGPTEFSDFNMENGLYSYNGVQNIQNIYEANQFPADPTFGFEDKTISKQDVGLKDNEAYIVPRSRGMDLWEWDSYGIYDDQQLENAMQGLINRNGPIMYIDHTNYTDHGGADAPLIEYYQSERDINFVKYNNWPELLEKTKCAYNGIIIYDDLAESNSTASFLMYNLANVSGCLPVQRSIYDKYRLHFSGMKIVAYFKGEIDTLKALDYMTTAILPLTDKDNAFCPDVKLDNSSEFATLLKRESSVSLDLAFSKKMFMFNIPTFEYLPTYVYFERIMRYLTKPAVIWGWVVSGSEATYSNWGHSSTEGTMTKNGSFHNAVPVKNQSLFPYTNTAPTKTTPENKVYIAFSGESLDASMFFYGQTFNAYNSDSRGSVKMNWGFAGEIANMYPSMAEYLIGDATQNDCFYNFIGNSYVHFDALAPNEINLFGSKTETASSNILANSPVQHFLGTMQKQKYSNIFNSMSNSKLFFMTNAEVPSSMYPYGYLKAVNNTQRYTSRSPAYMWQFNSNFTVGEVRNNSARLDINKTVTYLNQVYTAECNQTKPFFFTFWTQHMPETIDDYLALKNALDPSKFEVVDFTTMAELASNVPKTTLDNYEQTKITARNTSLVGKVSAITQTNTYSTNYISLLSQGTKNNVTVNSLSDGTKVNLSSINNGDNSYGTYSTPQTTLPEGARYCVMDIEGLRDNVKSWMFNMYGPFGMNAQVENIVLSGFSNDAGNTRSGRVVVPISPEIYSYTDQGYPVTIYGSIYGKNIGAEIKVTSVKFVSTLPQTENTLRINGSMGKMTTQPTIVSGTPYYDAIDIFKSLGFYTAVSGGTLTANKNNENYIINFVNGTSTRNGTTININDLQTTGGLNISYSALKLVLSSDYEVYYDSDRLELAINNINLYNPVAVTGVTLDKSTMSIVHYAMGTITATVTPSTATNYAINWSSSNSAVASVNSSGGVTGVSVGTATITATTVDGSYTATCTVTVTPVAVTGIDLDYSSISIGKQVTKQLTAIVNPSNADNKNVTWSTSNAAVATVSSSGLVTAVDVGTATITVTTADGGYTATCTVTVTRYDPTKYYKITYYSDSTLAMDTTNTGLGGVVKNVTYTGANSQQWQIIATNDTSTFKIVNRATGYVLNVNSTTNSIDKNIIQSTYVNQNSMNFTIADSGSYVKFVSKLGSNTYVKSTGTTGGTLVTAVDGTSKRWVVTLFP